MIKIFGVGEDDDFEELEDHTAESKVMEKEVGQLALDILETSGEIVILAPIAGIELDDIDLSFSKGILVLKGTRNKPDIFDGDVVIKNSECFWGSFVRNVILPENLDFDSIDASMENNLLIITIKKLHFNSQSIKINRTII